MHVRPLPGPATATISLPQQDTEAEVGRLIAEAYPWMLARARKITRNDQDAMDLVHDASIRMLRNHARWYGSEDGSIRPWALVIMRHTHISNLRRQAARISTFSDALIDDDSHLRGISLPSQYHSTLLHELIGAITTLHPPRFRRFVAHLLRGGDYFTTAEDLHMTLGHIKSEIHRIRVTLSTSDFQPDKMLDSENYSLVPMDPQYINQNLASLESLLPPPDRHPVHRPRGRHAHRTIG